MYDGLLSIDLVPEAKIVGFAGDIAIVLTSGTANLLELKTKKTIRRANEWPRSKGVEQLAVQKTKAVLVTNKRHLRSPDVLI